MKCKDVKYSYRKIWMIAYPILISTLIEQLIGMTDTAFLGRVSEVALGASALAGVYYMVQMDFYFYKVFNLILQSAYRL